MSHTRVAFLGCPPLQGSEGGQQNFMGVLETAMKIANQDADGEDEEEDGQKEAARVKNNNKTLPNCQVIFVRPRNLLCLSFNES